MILVGDLECPTLDTRNVDRIHCIVLMDLHSDTVFKFPPYGIDEAIALMERVDKVIFHNWTGYDYWIIKKLYPNFKPKGYEDSLVTSRLFYPNRVAHSIDSYGMECGIAKPVHEDWEEYGDEMLHRCSEDVRILKWLWLNRMEPEFNRYPEWRESVDLEYEVSLIHNEQVAHGVHFDMGGAKGLVTTLDAKIKEVYGKLEGGLPDLTHKGPQVNSIFKKDGTYTSHVLKYFGDIHV